MFHLDTGLYICKDIGLKKTMYIYFLPVVFFFFFAWVWEILTGFPYKEQKSKPPSPQKKKKFSNSLTRFILHTRKAKSSLWIFLREPGRILRNMSNHLTAYVSRG